MSSRTPVNYIVIFLAAVIAAVVLVFSSVSSEAVYPFERAWNRFSRAVSSRVGGALRGAAASAENLRLKREVASLSVLRGDIERLEAENERLRTALAYADAQHGEWVPAAVLSQDGSAAAPANILRVDKGTKDGIGLNAVVIVPSGLVGLVTEVSLHTAEITLITDQSIKVDCEVELAGGASARGILSGGSEALLCLHHFRSRGLVPPRSRVLTSGRGGVFPRGLEVGFFKGISGETGSLSRDGDVIPSVDFQNLEDVFIRREK